MPTPRKPVEQKRRAGNPGKRHLPEPLISVEQANTPPDPPATLGPTGTAAWERLWAGPASRWLTDVDHSIVELLCETIDEREQLRGHLAQSGHWRDRAGLRALDSQIVKLFQTLGLTPADRATLGLIEVRPSNILDSLRQRQQARTDRHGTQADT